MRKLMFALFIAGGLMVYSCNGGGDTAQQEERNMEEGTGDDAARSNGDDPYGTAPNDTAGGAQGGQEMEEDADVRGDEGAGTGADEGTARDNENTEGVYN